MAFKGQPKGHHEPYWDVVNRIIIESDIVLEVLDGRLVELSRNEEIERLVKLNKRPLIFVINKSDLVNGESLRKQVEALKSEGEVVFVSSKDRRTTKVLLYTIKKIFKKYGKRAPSIFKKDGPKVTFRETKANIVVGILGYPNVGKSSIINALAHKTKMKVSKKAGTTHGINWIRVNDEIKLIDSPGVIPLTYEDEVRYGLIGAKDIERLQNPYVVAEAIINLFMKTNKSAFERFYDIQINEGEEDYDSVVNKIGERKRFLLKGNRIDENRVGIMIVKDWQDGKLML
ncbi:MAG: GTPase [Nanoarchaeota archaeon]